MRGGGIDLYVVKLAATGARICATYLGGSGNDHLQAQLAVDRSGNAYVAGNTDSTNFPGTAAGVQSTLGGTSDAYMAKIGGFPPGPVAGGDLFISPSAATTAPHGSIAFTATSGTGPGVAWSMQAAPSGGTIAPNGVYTAGSTPNVTDVVFVSDGVGNNATASVVVTNAIAILPSSANVGPAGKIDFTGGGGAGNLTFTVSGGSGASISSTGNYQAGTTGNTVDTVKVTDATGAFATATVTVGSGLGVTPTQPTLPRARQP